MCLFDPPKVESRQQQAVQPPPPVPPPIPQASPKMAPASGPANAMASNGDEVTAKSIANRTGKKKLQIALNPTVGAGLGIPM